MPSRADEWIVAHLGEEPRQVLLRTYLPLLNDSTGEPAMVSYGADPWMTDRDMQIWTRVCDAYFFGVLSLGLLGLVAWRTDGDKRKLVIGLVMLGAMVTTCPFFGDARFKVPMMPLLCIAAVVPLRLLRRSELADGLAQQTVGVDQATVSSNKSWGTRGT